MRVGKWAMYEAIDHNGRKRQFSGQPTVPPGKLSWRRPRGGRETFIEMTNPPIDFTLTLKFIGDQPWMQKAEESIALADSGTARVSALALAVDEYARYDLRAACGDLPKILAFTESVFLANTAPSVQDTDALADVLRGFLALRKSTNTITAEVTGEQPGEAATAAVEATTKTGSIAVETQRLGFDGKPLPTKPALPLLPKRQTSAAYARRFATDLNYDAKLKLLKKLNVKPELPKHDPRVKQFVELEKQGLIEIATNKDGTRAVLLTDAGLAIIADPPQPKSNATALGIDNASRLGPDWRRSQRVAKLA